MKRESKLLVLLIGYILNINAQCSFPGLNLTALINTTFECAYTVTDPVINNYLVSYSICAQNVRCSTIGAPYRMVTQEDELADDCFYLAVWDPDILPVQTNTDPIEYTFNYKNGEIDGCASPRTIDITFICDTTADPYGDTECGETEEPCGYYYKIKTIYACSEAPNNECIWNSGGKTLNLTLFGENNVVLSEIDASNSNNVIGFTPCRNGLECTQDFIKKLAYNLTDTPNSTIKDGNVMGFLAEIDDLKCLQTLSIWNNGAIQPSYDSQNEIWQFIYEIPDVCDGLTSVFVVYYKCNPNVFYTIESALTVTKCLYQMTIQTYVAC